MSRVLVITHGGFIMEFLNVIRNRKKLAIKFENNSKFSSIYVIKIYCFTCGGKCKINSNKSDCRLEYDLIVYNNTTHLGKKVKLLKK